eukprot:Rhum_TRINITY_DN5033_c0_g1::Rhum_TRINITY_DN5033_c0_g1_i1::g.16305::m.16305
MQNLSADDHGVLTLQLRASQVHCEHSQCLTDGKRDPRVQRGPGVASRERGPAQRGLLVRRRCVALFEKPLHGKLVVPVVAGPEQVGRHELQTAGEGGRLQHRGNVLLCGAVAHPAHRTFVALLPRRRRDVNGPAQSGEADVRKHHELLPGQDRGCRGCVADEHDELEQKVVQAGVAGLKGPLSAVGVVRQPQPRTEQDACQPVENCAERARWAVHLLRVCVLLAREDLLRYRQDGHAHLAEGLNEQRQRVVLVQHRRRLAPLVGVRSPVADRHSREREDARGQRRVRLHKRVGFFLQQARSILQQHRDRVRGFDAFGVLRNLALHLALRQKFGHQTVAGKALFDETHGIHDGAGRDTLRPRNIIVRHGFFGLAFTVRVVAAVVHDLVVIVSQDVDPIVVRKHGVHMLRVHSVFAHDTVGCVVSTTQLHKIVRASSNPSTASSNDSCMCVCASCVTELNEVQIL